MFGIFGRKFIPTPERKYHCKKCKAHMFSYGSFKPEFPDYKEVRLYQVYKPEQMQTYEVKHPVNGSTIALLAKCRCNGCGTMNMFNIVMTSDKRLKFQFTH